MMNKLMAVVGSVLASLVASATVTRTTKWYEVPDETLVGTVVDLSDMSAAFSYTTAVSNKIETTKQPMLVSGTNIKTINNQSLLGSGNLVIQGGGGGDPNAVTNIYTNGVSIVVDRTADIWSPVSSIATNVAASAAVTNAGAVAEAKAYVDAALAYKMDLVEDPTAGNLATINASGGIEDSGVKNLLYSNNRAYAVGEPCVRNGLLYVCTTAISSQGEAWDPFHWLLVKDFVTESRLNDKADKGPTQNDGYLAAFDANGNLKASYLNNPYYSRRAFAVGEMCVYNSKLYVCKTAIQLPGEDFTPSHWQGVVDIATAISGLVPYTGATSDVNLGNHNISVRKVVMNNGTHYIEPVISSGYGFNFAAMGHESTLWMDSSPVATSNMVEGVVTSKGFITQEQDPTATAKAEAVVAQYLDYALTNLTGAAVTLRSGEIGNVTLGANIALDLDFSTTPNRSGDCMLYAINATATDYDIDPTNAYTYVSTDLAKALTIGKATTNILMFTRLKNDTVLVSKQEVK